MVSIQETDPERVLRAALLDAKAEQIAGHLGAWGWGTPDTPSSSSSGSTGHVGSGSVSQPATTPAPGPSGRAKASPPPAPAAPAQPHVGGFAPGGNGAPGGKRDTHPGQAFSGIGNPAGHRAYYLAIAKHELAGAAGVREGDAMLRREIRRADNLTSPQKAKAMWRIRRANRRLAGAMEAAARAAATGAKVRAEVNADILSAKRKRRAGGFTAV